MAWAHCWQSTRVRFCSGSAVRTARQHWSSAFLGVGSTGCKSAQVALVAGSTRAASANAACLGRRPRVGARRHPVAPLQLAVGCCGSSFHPWTAWLGRVRARPLAMTRPYRFGLARRLVGSCLAHHEVVTLSEPKVRSVCSWRPASSTRICLGTLTSIAETGAPRVRSTMGDKGQGCCKRAMFRSGLGT